MTKLPSKLARRGWVKRLTSPPPRPAQQYQDTPRVWTAGTTTAYIQQIFASNSTG